MSDLNINPNLRFTFSHYLNLVSSEMCRIAGDVISTDDFDYRYRDCYDDGLTPSETATNALAYAGFYSDIY